MKKYKIAAILMIIHGGFMELGGIFAMIPALLIGTDKYDIGQYFEFKLLYPSLNEQINRITTALSISKNFARFFLSLAERAFSLAK